MIVCITLSCQASLRLYFEHESFVMTLPSSPADCEGSLTPANEVIITLWFICLLEHFRNLHYEADFNICTFIWFDFSYKLFFADTKWTEYVYFPPFCATSDEDECVRTHLLLVWRVFFPRPVAGGAAAEQTSELWMCWDLGSHFSHLPLIHHVRQFFHFLSLRGQC